MVLKGVNWVHNDKVRSNGLEMSQLCTQWVLCTQLTPFKKIWPNLIIMYPIDSFQDHITWFLHCVLNSSNWLLLSRPYDLILSLCTHLTALNSILIDFVLCTQLTPFKTIWPNFINVYPIFTLCTYFYQCVPNQLLSRQYYLIFILHT